jgi:hypothetical protein
VTQDNGMSFQFEAPRAVRSIAGEAVVTGTPSLTRTKDDSLALEPPQHRQLS